MASVPPAAQERAPHEGEVRCSGSSRRRLGFPSRTAPLTVSLREAPSKVRSDGPVTLAARASTCSAVGWVPARFLFPLLIPSRGRISCRAASGSPPGLTVSANFCNLARAMRRPGRASCERRARSDRTALGSMVRTGPQANAHRRRRLRELLRSSRHRAGRFAPHLDRNARSTCPRHVSHEVRARLASGQPIESSARSLPVCRKAFWGLEFAGGPLSLVVLGSVYQTSGGLKPCAAPVARQ